LDFEEMTDQQKTRAQLIQELEALRRTIAAFKRKDFPNRPLPRAFPDREPHLHSIIDNLLSGMIYRVVRRPDGSRVFAYLSDTVRRFYGITPEEGLADAGLIYNRVHESDRARVFQEEEEANRTLRPFRSEVRMMGPDNEIRWSLFVSHPRPLEDGSTCWDGIEFDITERKQIEVALRVSEEKFSKIFKTIPDAVAIARWRDGVYLDVNESYSQITGYSREELIGHSPLSGDLNLWVHNEDRAPFAAALKEKGQALGLEIQFRHKNGTIRKALLSARALDLEGEPCHVAIIRDITEQKNAQKTLRESQERLRALSAHLQTVREEERSNISREIHDDLGQLLTGLKMDLSWILRHSNRDPAELQEKAKAMGQVIDQTVHTVRRISTELRPRILDDFGLVAALEWQAEEFSKKTGIACRFGVKGRSLALKPDLSIAVFRIFQEALTNVARHSGATRVEASVQKKAGDLLLRVRDNGRGISEDEALRSKSLGLVGMRERALLFGGAVSIEGKKGKGTTVILRLPIVEGSP
jgi:PAS domain S-box-containing protein